MDGVGCLKWPNGNEYNGIKNKIFIKDSLLMERKRVKDL